QHIAARLDNGFGSAGAGVVLGLFQHPEEIGEIDLPAQDETDDGHYHIFHQRIDDLAESRADDHTDGKVDHVALDRELTKLSQKTSCSAHMRYPLVISPDCGLTL